MPDPQNRDGRWLQRTADRGPDYPEPEWQYIPPDRGILKITDLTSDAEPDRIIDIADRPGGDGTGWPDLPNGRELIEIIDGRDPSAPTAPTDDDWAGPDWACGASLSDFIRYLSPDIWRRLQSTRDSAFGYAHDDGQIQHNETGEGLGMLSERLRNYLKISKDRWSDLDNWERSSRIRDVAIHLVLEKTETGRELCLKFLRRSLDTDWVTLPQIWRDKLKRFGTLGPPGAPTKCIDPVGSTISYDGETFELAVFKSAPDVSLSAARANNVNHGGRPRTFDWEGLVFEIARIAAFDGLPAQPSELLHYLMDKWIPKNWDRVPTESEVRKRVSRAYSTPGLAV